MSRHGKEAFLTLNRALLLGLLMIILLAVVKYSFVPLLSRRIILDANATAISRNQHDKPTRSRISEATMEQVRNARNKQSMTFVENEGQQNMVVKYSAQGQDYAIYFTQNEAVFAFTKQVDGTDGLPTPDGKRNHAISETDSPIQGVALILQFLGTNPNTGLQGLSRTSSRGNYFVDGGSQDWQTGGPSYKGIAYKGLWPGIDLVFRGEKSQLKYDFIVKPGARISDIKLTYQGDRGLSIDKSGTLLIKTPLGELADKRPIGFQYIHGKKTPVAMAFTLRQANGKNLFGFTALKGYNPRYSLVIDPLVTYRSR